MGEKLVFVCQECGYRSPGWLGRCPGCNRWNSFVEEIDTIQRGYQRRPEPTHPPKPLLEVEANEDLRLKTNLQEFDRILGGGIVAGSVILIGGEPGIGKSTLLLQVAELVSSQKDVSVLYVSGEESLSQTKLRANRLGTSSRNLFIVSETNLELILDYIKNLAPQLVVIDSIQTVYKPDLPSAPGTISQVRESAGELTYLAKSSGIPVMLIGHVTKEGSIAGPRILEHTVDTVLYFEGERYHDYRVLRCVKNRFGATFEIGVFEMTASGLIEVANPSQIFLAERSIGGTGAMVVPVLEGTRPILVEIQALVTPTNFGLPQRRAMGVDYNRVSLLLAVLEKRVGLEMGKYDVFVNLAGGIRVQEPATDLGICIACCSSYKDLPANPGDVALGEVSLGGEVRAVTHAKERILEAEKLGFLRCIIGEQNLKGLGDKKRKIEIVACATIDEALKAALRRR